MSQDNRRSKRLTMAALITGIVELSIGFAAFSNTLTLSSSAAVTPDQSNFRVVFTKTSGTIDESAVVPTKTSRKWSNNKYNKSNTKEFRCNIYRTRTKSRIQSICI